MSNEEAKEDMLRYISEDTDSNPPKDNEVEYYISMAKQKLESAERAYESLEDADSGEVSSGV